MSVCPVCQVQCYKMLTQCWHLCAAAKNKTSQLATEISLGNSPLCCVVRRERAGPPAPPGQPSQHAAADHNNNKCVVVIFTFSPLVSFTTNCIRWINISWTGWWIKHWELQFYILHFSTLCHIPHILPSHYSFFDARIYCHILIFKNIYLKLCNNFWFPMLVSTYFYMYLCDISWWGDWLNRCGRTHFLCSQAWWNSLLHVILIATNFY